MQVIVDELLTNYEIAGKGNAVLFLHGWGSQGNVLNNLATNLQNTHTTIIVDLPGFGNSQMPTSAWGLRNYAEHVSNFLKKINTTPKFIISHSIGSAIAIEAISGSLLTPEKLVMIGAAGIRNTEKTKKGVLKIISKAGKPLLFVLPNKSKQKVRSKWYEAIGSDMLFAPEMEQTYKKAVSEDVLEKSRSVNTKTLLIYGEQDESTPPLFGQLYFENMPNAQLEIVADAGHFVFNDRPEVVSKLIKDFI